MKSEALVSRTNTETVKQRPSRRRTIAWLLLVPFPAWLFLSFLIMLPQIIHPCAWPCSEGWGWFIMLGLAPVAVLLFIPALIGAALTFISWQKLNDWRLRALALFAALVFVGLLVAMGPDILFMVDLIRFLPVFR